jgi:uncharacterized protein (TIGR02246 family)
MSADEQAIRKLIDDWMQATAKGDLAKVLSMMSDDVVFMTASRSRSRSRCSATGRTSAITSPSR